MYKHCSLTPLNPSTCVAPSSLVQSTRTFSKSNPLGSFPKHLDPSWGRWPQLPLPLTPFPPVIASVYAFVCKLVVAFEYSSHTSDLDWLVTGQQGNRGPCKLSGLQSPSEWGHLASCATSCLHAVVYTLYPHIRRMLCLAAQSCQGGASTTPISVDFSAMLQPSMTRRSYRSSSPLFTSGQLTRKGASALSMAWAR